MQSCFRSSCEVSYNLYEKCIQFFRIVEVIADLFVLIDLFFNKSGSVWWDKFSKE